MKIHRKKRLYVIIAVLFGVGLSAFLVFYALGQNVNLYFTPTQVFEHQAPAKHSFRMGGMVQKSSVVRTEGSLDVDFVVTDFNHEVAVHYNGILPALFREGQGVVIEGKLENNKIIATQVLAKHDEKYMPPGLTNKNLN